VLSGAGLSVRRALVFLVGVAVGLGLATELFGLNQEPIFDNGEAVAEALGLGLASAAFLRPRCAADASGDALGLASATGLLLRRAEGDVAAAGDPVGLASALVRCFLGDALGEGEGDSV
jgi:hypothetical protein